VVVALAAILTLTTPTLPQAEAQVRVTTVTVYVRTLQTVYVRVLQTVIQTVKFPVTHWNKTTYWNTTTWTYWNTTTTGQTVSKSITETASVTAPIQIGPFSLDLTDAGGLRFLAFTGAVALAGLVSGALAARLSFRHRKPDGGIIGMTEAYTELDKRTDAWQDQVIDAFESADQGGTNVTTSETIGEADSEKHPRKRKPDSS
jgi:hypothetical protein